MLVNPYNSSITIHIPPFFLFLFDYKRRHVSRHMSDILKTKTNNNNNSIKTTKTELTVSELLATDVYAFICLFVFLTYVSMLLCSFARTNVNLMFLKDRLLSSLFILIHINIIRKICP